jgi:hypothetical protein
MTMRIVAALKPVCPLALALALASPLAAALQDAEAAMGRDGLQKISIKDLDLAFARPGATLTAYRRIQVEPVAVEFSRQWNPERTGSRLKMTSEERERIRAALAGIVQHELARGLQQDGRYQLANEAGPDVLRIRPRLLKVYINAPDASNAPRTRTYTWSAGEMTLLAELNDSASGKVLARIADRRESDNFRLQLTNGMVNENEARTIAAAWARALRKALDGEHGIAP